MHKNKNIMTVLYKLLVLFSGSVIMSYGITMYLKAGLGTDPITTLVEGVSKTMGISVGRASQLTSGLLIVVTFMIDRKRIGLGTFVNAFLTGELLNLFMNMDLNPTTIAMRLIVLAVGVITFAIGLALFIISKLGEGPVDALMLIFIDRTHMSIGKARIIVDTILVLGGAILGASVGVGTLAGTFLTGVIMGKTIKFANHYIIWI